MSSLELKVIFIHMRLWSCELFVLKYIICCDKKEKKRSRIAEDLAKSRAVIREAVRSKKYVSENEETFVPRGAVYRNVYAFHQ